MHPYKLVLHYVFGLANHWENEKVKIHMEYLYMYMDSTKKIYMYNCSQDFGRMLIYVNKDVKKVY